MFGVLKPGYGLGYENTYDSKANLIGLTEKTKNYLFVDLNNIGFDSNSDLSLFESGQDIDIAALNARLPAAKTFIRSFQRPRELEDERSNFNNSEMTSLSDLFTLSEKVKIKTHKSYLLKGFQTLCVRIAVASEVNSNWGRDL